VFFQYRLRNKNLLLHVQNKKPAIKKLVTLSTMFEPRLICNQQVTKNLLLLTGNTGFVVTFG